jgi:hypothetical protein
MNYINSCIKTIQLYYEVDFVINVALNSDWVRISLCVSLGSHRYGTLEGNLVYVPVMDPGFGSWQYRWLFYRQFSFCYYKLFHGQFSWIKHLLMAKKKNTILKKDKKTPKWVSARFQNQEKLFLLGVWSSKFWNFSEPVESWWPEPVVHSSILKSKLPRETVRLPKKQDLRRIFCSITFLLNLSHYRMFCMILTLFTYIEFIKSDFSI